MVKSKEEIMSLLKRIVEKTATDDDIVTLLEDISDTLDSQVPEVSTEEWEGRLKELDESWRKRYIDRFFGDGGEEDSVEITEESDGAMIEEEKTMMYESLFKEEE